MTDKPDKPAKADGRARLAELLGSDSTNFLGTGLTLREFSQLHDAEKIAAAWCLQSREEQKRRRRAVIQLAIELGRVQASTNFSTRFAECAIESVIESVIEGDWPMVQEWADHFAFTDDDAQIRARHAPTFETFRELLLQTLRTRKEPAA